MKPQQLVEKLEALGFVDGKTIEKIRREIDNPEKKTSVRGILNFLVKKGHVTEAQAKNILSQARGSRAVAGDEVKSTTPKKVKHDDLKVVKTSEKEFDTNDLTANVEPTNVEPTRDVVEKTAEAGLTRLDALPHVEPVEEATQMVEVQALKPVDYLAVPEPLDAFGGEGDPLGYDQALDPYQSGAQAAQPQTLAGFAGKRDQSNQWQNKWLFIGFGILGTLIIVGAVLVFATGFVTAEDRFKAAMDSFENGAYKDSVSKFDEFVERYPKHEKTSVAKVRRVQALLADTYKEKNWDETIKRAENELPALEEDEDVDFGPVRDDLAFMLPTSTLNIAKRAKKQPTIEAMEKELEMARRANAIVNNPVYIPGSTRKSATVAKLLDDIANTIASCEGLIRKEEDYANALAEIEDLADQSKTDDAFVRYNKLIRVYGDLAARDELREKMKRVSQQEQELVQDASFKTKVSKEESASVVEKTIVLASKSGEPIDSLRGEVLPVLSDGSVFGVDLGDGSVRWRRFVGFQTSIQPVVFDTETVLISNQSSNELMRIDSESGSIVWRAVIGQPFNAPTVNEKQIVLSTADGHVLNVDSMSGSVLNAVKLPQKTSVNPTFSPRNPYLYQPGMYSNLYVLSSEDMACKDVYYLGHYKGSVSVPPVFWSGYLLVAENGSDTCDLHILRPKNDGLELEPVQKIRRVTTGPVNTNMVRFGRWLLITSDNGDMKVLELNTSNDQNPISVLAQEKYENDQGAESFLLAEGSQLWIAGKGIKRYKIQRALGQFNREGIYNGADYFLGPMAKYGNTLIHNRRRMGSGHVSVSGVDSKTLAQAWRSDISGPLAGPPIFHEGEMLALSSQGDLFDVDPNLKYSDKAIKSSQIEEDLLFDRIIPFSDEFVVAVGPAGRPDVLAVDLKNKTTEKLTLQNPGNQSACHPFRVGDVLIVASRRGNILRVDPKTGRNLGGSFLPPVTPGKLTEWYEPAMVNETQFVIPDGSGVLYHLAADDPTSLKKMSDLELGVPIKSACAAIGPMVYAVVGGVNSDELVSFRVNGGLAKANSVPLAASSSSGPWTVGDLVLLKLDNDQLICLDADLNQKWSLAVANDELACPPYDEDGLLNLVFKSGKMLELNSASGEVVNRFDLGQPIIHRPIQSGKKTYFSGVDGTIHVTDTP